MKQITSVAGARSTVVGGVSYLSCRECVPLVVRQLFFFQFYPATPQ